MLSLIRVGQAVLGKAIKPIFEATAIQITVFKATVPVSNYKSKTTKYSN
jgi:hypothetical protein